MQKFEFLWQPLLGDWAMSPEEEEEEKKNAIYSGHLRLCQQPRAEHALRSDQNAVHDKTRQNKVQDLNNMLQVTFYAKFQIWVRFGF